MVDYMDNHSDTLWAPLLSLLNRGKLALMVQKSQTCVVSCKISSLHNTLKLKQWFKSNKWTRDRKDFGVIALHSPQVRGYRDLNSCSCRVPIILDQDNIVWVKARSHARSGHFVSNDKCLLLLSFDGQQHSVANFSYAVFGVDVDHSWCTVVRCISQRAVVNHSHSGHLLNGCSDSRNTEGTKKGNLSLLETHTVYL